MNLTRRLSLATVLVAVLALLAAPAPAAVWTNLNGVTTTGAGTALALPNTPGVQAHIYSSAGSSATVVVQGAMSSAGPWITLATSTNPSATGECFQGTPFPWLRANATARASGTLYAVFRDLSEDPGPWSSCIGAASSSIQPGLLKYSFTNAQIVAGGSGGTSYNLPIGTLPAKARVLATYLTVDGQATFAAGTLTGSVGVAGTAYADWIVASDLKAAAATVYGDAAAERGATNIDGQLYYSTAKSVYLQVLAGAGDLANVTGSSGTVTVVYEVLP